MSIEVIDGTHEEDVLTVELLFHEGPLRQAFRQFLVHSRQRIVSLRLESGSGDPRMLLEVRPDRGRNRSICLVVSGSPSAGEIRTSTPIVSPAGAAAIHLVLLFMSSHDYPRYNLEVRNDASLLLCCRRKTPAVNDEQDFHDLIVCLADVAERVEAAGAPFPASGSRRNNTKTVER